MLLTPGPTDVPEFIRYSMAKQTIHHRTKEFKDIFQDTREMLLKLLGTKSCVILASSGTGAMEATVTNFCFKKALTINSGKFGERWGKICQATNKDFVELKYEWNTPTNTKDILEAIKSNKDIDAVFLQVCESAGGLRQPVEQIAKAIKDSNKDIIVVADAITAVGVEHINTKDIDVLIAGSQKALMLPPGLSVVGLNEKAIEKIGQKPTGYYFNLFAEFKKQEQNTTAYTAPTTLIIGLNEVLKKFETIGLDNLYKDTKKRAEASREALKAIGLTIYPKTPADAMTTIKTDKAEKIRELLKSKFDVNIAGGQDHLKGNIFRINHMGLIEPYQASWVLNSIEKSLEILGIRKFNGEANRVFMEVYFA